MFQPLTIPLTNGLTQNVSDLDARRPGIAYAENVDFTKEGEVAIRPGMTNHDVVMVRTLDVSSANVFDEELAFDDLVVDPKAMIRYRDSNGERAALVGNGRVWTWEGANFADRLYCGASRVDRLAELFDSEFPLAVGYNFMQAFVATAAANLPGSPLLGGTNPSIQTYDAQLNQNLAGQSCDVVADTDVYHCSIGNLFGLASTTTLTLVVRKNDETTLTSIPIDAPITTVAAFDGGLPCIASEPFGQNPAGPLAWTVYRVAGGFKLARINVLTGAQISTTVALANIIGLWVSTDLASNKVYVAITRSGISGVRCSSFNATTLADLATTVQFDTANLTNAAGPVVIGPSNTTGVAWVAYDVATTNKSLVIGTYTSTGSSQVYKTYFGSANQEWGVFHQPMLFGEFADRTVLGIYYAIAHPAFGSALSDATWFEIDITDMVPAGGGPQAYGTKNPGILSKGPTFGTVRPTCARSAIAAPNRLSWRFASNDFLEFNVTLNGGVKGVNPFLGLNEVKLIGPRAASVGEETVISGSVPHFIARGYCSEVGFPLGAPEMSITTGVGVDSYSVQACWVKTDAAGVTHRSAPSDVQTVVASNGNITAVINQCQLTEQEVGFVQAELYRTEANAPANAVKYLTSTGFSLTGPTVSLNTSIFSNTTLRLYTEGGSVFANTHVSADGGVTTVGRRMWLSDGRKVFASKVFRPNGLGPAWNDEGVIEVNPPAPAGRVLAIEQMDDKLVMLCERGIHVTQGDGPDDTGVGPDFLFPVTLSNLGVSNERGSVSTASGVAFHCANTGLTGAGYGGIYLVDRGLNVRQLSLPVMDELSTVPAELAYIPERDLLVVNLLSKFLVLDMRSNNWSVWTFSTPNPARCITSAAGTLWGLLSFGGDTAKLGSFDGDDGFDSLDGFVAKVTTNKIFANGADGLGWAKCKSVRVLGQPSTGTLTITVTPDDKGPVMTKLFQLENTTQGNAWPTNRYAPEFKLPYQKASSFQVTLTYTALAALGETTPKWSALQLLVLPSRRTAPTNQRG